MMTPRSSAIVPVLVLFVFASGCGTLEMYDTMDGEPLPDEELAYVYRDTPAYQWGMGVTAALTVPIGLLLFIPMAWGDQETSIRGVDSREVGTWSALCNSRAAVLPGSHSFEVGVRRDRETLYLRCQKGHRYQLQAYNPWNDDPTLVWAIDLDTRELVAGKAPEDVAAALEQQREAVRKRQEAKEREAKDEERVTRPQKRTTGGGRKRSSPPRKPDDDRMDKELDDLLNDL